MEDEAGKKAETQAARDAAVKAAFEAYDEGRTIPGEDGKPERPKPKEDIDTLWEAMWQAADFSWQGLADAGWDRGPLANAAQKLKRWRAPADFPGGGPVQGEGEARWKQATLQEYWRWSLGLEPGGASPRLLTDDELTELGLLKTFDGVTYHLLHCPGVQLSAGRDRLGIGTDRGNAAALARPEDGSGGEAAAAGQLVGMLEARLRLPQPAADSAEDARLQSAGARAAGLDDVLRAHFADTGEAIALSAPLARFDRFDAHRLKFATAADFDRATFGDQARFYGATFGDKARFSGARFGDRVGFLRARFGGGADFSSALFGDRARFYRANFGDGADFSAARFGDGARFSHVGFGDRARFYDATLGDRAGFSGARFSHGAYFWGARFGDRARFSDATFGDGAVFIYATFGNEAGFFQATFGNKATFSAATFGNKARFFQATFGNDARFWGAHFGDGANFSSATFRGTAKWDRVIFQGSADFSDVIWDETTHYGGAFDSARFEDVVNFKTPNFSAYAAFDDVTHKQKLLLAAPSNGLRPRDMWRRARAAAKRAVTNGLAAEAKDADAPPYLDWLLRQIRLTRRRARREIKRRIWSQLSGGYRVAKKAMEAQGDFGREQTYYRFEVKARMRRPDISLTERFVSFFYNHVSNYGASIGRPFVGLGVFFVIFSMIYLAMGAAFTGAKVEMPWQAEAPYVRLEAPAPATWQAGEFSFGNAFRPLWALSARKPETVEVLGDRLLFHEHGGVRLLTKVFVVLQSLLSVVLAFLFALAVRRKFQIS
ncbi:MAG: pentapeptide repeat-containing protein [Pseudomonadota bacterium]